MSREYHPNSYSGDPGFTCHLMSPTPFIRGQFKGRVNKNTT
jgi:hypothetical protein